MRQWASIRDIAHKARSNKHSSVFTLVGAIGRDIARKVRSNKQGAFPQKREKIPKKYLKTEFASQTNNGQIFYSSDQAACRTRWSMRQDLRDKIKAATEASAISKPDFVALLKLIDQHYDKMEATITESLQTQTFSATDAPIEAIFDSE